MDRNLSDPSFKETLSRFVRRMVGKLLHVYWRFSRGMTLGVRGAVFNEQGQICLVRHTYIPGWHLPGGGVEPGQTLLQALERECREETGLEFLSEPVLHGVFFNDYVSRRDHVAVFYIVKCKVKDINKANAEIAEVKFFDLHALPSSVTEGTRRRITEISEGHKAPALW
jgi:ADP-ribose pyrophosphatase YjhB (NUDIX family)